ncbi:UNVERIFIED_CONTAM: BLOC-1 complex subunit 8 [Gekko kuhli]
MEEPEMQLKVKKVTDKFTESMYVLANEPSVALYRLQEHVRRSLPELAQHKASSVPNLKVEAGRSGEQFSQKAYEMGQLGVVGADMQSWEEQSQGAIYTVEYACSAIKNMKDSCVYFKSIDGLLRNAIAVKEQLNSTRR